jgi:hypothetical protein
VPAPPTPDRPSLPAPDLLLRALARLLRPLVRLLIRSGVTFPAMADLLRNLYVEVARNELLTEPRARTDSRVSLLTGVHRKEIRRQRTPETDPEPRALTLSSQVIARWLGTPGLVDSAGRPLPLRRVGAAPSFEALVTAVTTDVRPRALLDEWVDAGIAAVDPQGLVRLEQGAFLPRGGGQEQLFYFARNLHDHIAAASANVAAPGAPPFLDRSVHYDRLSLDAAARLAAAAREAAQAMLLNVNRIALGIADADDAARAEKEQPAPTRRVNLGVYLYVEDEPPSEGT